MMEDMPAEWGKISSREILAAVKGRMISGNPQTRFTGFSSDSRHIDPGGIFWALKGDRFDGHDFVSRAIEQGALGVVVQEVHPSLKESPRVVVISVADTLRALGDLAAWWRRQHTAKVIAITGSSGKTTTKEMTADILQIGTETLKNQGNHNNLIGLPATLLKLTKAHQRAVLEMGMNRRGEIARLTEIATPDVGIILNVGMAHLEGLGTLEGVAKAKTELMDRLPPKAQMVLNGDDDMLMKHAGQFNKKYITFGLRDNNSIRGVNIENRGSEGMGFDLVFNGDTWPICLSVSGLHNVKNALAAAAIAFCLDVPPEHIVKGLGLFTGVKGRFQTIPLKNHILLVDDTYNANPSALQASLVSAAALVPKGGRFLVGLGDMLELGDTAVSAHREAGSRVAGSGASWLFAMGTHADHIKYGALSAGMPEKHIVIVETHDELIMKISREIKTNDTILLKGSRKMQFEKVVEGIRKTDNQ